MPWDKEIYKHFTGRKTETMPVKKVIEAMFRKYQLSGKFKEKSVLNAWDKLMGTSISKRTSKKFVKNGVLFVEITSPPLKNDLNLSKEKIIYLYEQEFVKGILKDIRFL